MENTKRLGRKTKAVGLTTALTVVIAAVAEMAGYPVAGPVANALATLITSLAGV